jgi:hypothetical protein
MTIMEPFYSDHTRLDERSLALHQLVAEKVRAAPALLDKARENVRRLAGSERKRLARFGRMGADSDIPRQPMVALLAERSERATRLRQSSPFAGILSEEERRAVYESYSARTYHPRREPNFG